MPERTRSRRGAPAPAAGAGFGSGVSLIGGAARRRKGAIVDLRPQRADTLWPLMKNIVILISGRGSNMEAIVRTSAAESWPARSAAVISNRADAGGLGFARDHGIATAVVDH